MEDPTDAEEVFERVRELEAREARVDALERRVERQADALRHYRAVVTDLQTTVDHLDARLEALEAAADAPTVENDEE